MYNGSVLVSLCKTYIFNLPGWQQPLGDADSEERTLRRLKEPPTLGPDHPTALQINKSPNNYATDEENRKKPTRTGRTDRNDKNWPPHTQGNRQRTFHEAL